MRRGLAAVLAAVAAFAATGCGGGKPLEPVSASVCGPLVYHGQGKPDLLIVSDLPLRAPPPARKQVAGIEYVLRQRGYKAGRYRVAYQSCDDSSARTGGPDPTRCASNMRAYAADARVVGVIGPYNSQCAYLQIAVANAAPKGPLVMIGTATTDPELTAAVPGGDVGTPDKFYPKRTRNFVRLTAPDQFQAAAAVMLARRLHAKRVFVLGDGEAYGDNLAAWFRQDAKRLGVPLAGSATWNQKAASYADLAATVAAGKPDAVYLGGLVFPPVHGGDVLRALQTKLANRHVAYIAPDGFLDPQSLGLDPGVYITVANFPHANAHAEGKKILAATPRDTYFGGLGYGALYGAAAAHVLLDAIAASDGSRASVTKGVFAAHTPPGIIGRFGFDSEGDPTVGAVTIVQLEHGRLKATGVLFPSDALAKDMRTPSP
jgi:branched-chain amino acid transport system substrate-binding protein